MDMNTRVAEFIEELEEQGFSCNTEPCENISKVWGPKAFRTTIKKGRTRKHFYTYAGEGWGRGSRSNTEAFRSIQEEVLGFPNYDSYEAWNRDQSKYYEELLGKRAARSYYSEIKQAEKVLREALGEELFEQFYNLDQE